MEGLGKAPLHEKNLKLFAIPGIQPSCPCVKPKGSYALAMPWLCLGYALPMPWLCSGYALAMPWLCPGYALAMPWLCTGYALAMH